MADEVETLAHRTIPSFDFFLFTMFAAAIITSSILVDSPALLVLGALTAPAMTPFLGIGLGSATGSLKFFSQRLAGSLVASGFVFLIGILGGYASLVLKATQVQFLIYNARISWTHFVLLITGTVLAIITLKKQGKTPILPSAAIAYELYIPLAMAGYGFGSGQPHLWPDGLVVFGIHLAALAIVGTMVFMIMGIRPLTFLGYTLGSLVAISSILGVIGLSSAGAIVGGKIALPTPIPSATYTSTPLPPSFTPSITPVPPTPTPSPTMPTPTSTPQPTATPTETPKPTPFYAEIAVSEEYAGAYIRSAPSLESQILTSLVNGTVIEILNPSPSFDEQSRSWLNIRFMNEDGQEQDGWIIQNLLRISTPRPDW
jgi:hypothetical protein